MDIARPKKKAAHEYREYGKWNRHLFSFLDIYLFILFISNVVIRDIQNNYFGYRKKLFWIPKIKPIKYFISDIQIFISDIQNNVWVYGIDDVLGYHKIFSNI